MDHECESYRSSVKWGVRNSLVFNLDEVDQNLNYECRRNMERSEAVRENSDLRLWACAYIDRERRERYRADSNRHLRLDGMAFQEALDGAIAISTMTNRHFSLDGMAFQEALDGAILTI